ncbi:hypothetical protein [Yinghuangia soli]|uniref:DUF2637 domain-containing protein n=1 Tax=Yinghuangia soli TaxID=2908204 RepID=A0AA41TYP5_9ACTN|nr:hypothetical protein [Yinghuangia soli]MCF2526621.1 hypothetical protein [Yinghuangia soli]
MTETLYTMSAHRRMDRARIEEANAAASERTALAAVVQAQAAAQVAEIRRQEERSIRAETGADKAQARAARQERVSKALGSVRERRDFALVSGVMVASIGTAWPAQMGFYLAMGMNPVLSVLVTAMTEGAAWAGAAMASKAIEDGDRPAGIYRAITWGSAFAAAALNFAHTWHRSIPLACVLALASLLGVLLWEAYAHSRTQTEGGKSGAQIRAEIYRKARFRKVSRRTRDLIAAVPGLDPDAAWVIAWRAVYGADPGVTRRTLKQHHKAVKAIAKLLDKALESGAESVGLAVLQTPTATLADMAPGGTVAESVASVRDAESFAFAAADPIEELIGSADVDVDADDDTGDDGESVRESGDGADESGARSVSNQKISSNSTQNGSRLGRATAGPRRATGRVPESAKSVVPKRNVAEMLAEARELTADWPTDRLTADRIREEVRTSAKSARILRDTLRAERESGGGADAVGMAS